MSSTNAPARTSDSAPDGSDDVAGLAHLTVVPTNFDPDAPGGRRD